METDQDPSGRADTNVRPKTKLAQDLVFAIAHEIGNHLGGIRLHAHLLDEELDARALADASVAIDSLAGRSGPLLSLLRPLLADEWKDSERVTWHGLLLRVAEQIEDQGTQGVRFEVEFDLDPSVRAPGYDWLFSLFIALLDATLAEVPRKRGVCVRIARGDGSSKQANEIVVAIEDEGPDEDVSPGAAHCGRPLCLALARELLGRIGGRVEALRDADRTRVKLFFPERAGAA